VLVFEIYLLFALKSGRALEGYSRFPSVQAGKGRIIIYYWDNNDRLIERHRENALKVQRTLRLPMQDSPKNRVKPRHSLFLPPHLLNKQHLKVDIC
jgi:hypothetical protein